jgi:hypothetical protein
MRTFKRLVIYLASFFPFACQSNNSEEIFEIEDGTYVWRADSTLPPIKRTIHSISLEFKGDSVFEKRFYLDNECSVFETKSKAKITADTICFSNVIQRNTENLNCISEFTSWRAFKSQCLGFRYSNKTLAINYPSNSPYDSAYSLEYLKLGE